MTDRWEDEGGSLEEFVQAVRKAREDNLAAIERLAGIQPASIEDDD